MRHETNYNSVNLLYNGGWELVDSKGEPAFWDIDGASLEDDLSIYSVGPDGLTVQITSRADVSLTQTFNVEAGPLDFSGNLGTEDYRGMPYGYTRTPARRLSAQDDWTLSFDLTRAIGPCQVRVRVDYVGGSQYMAHRIEADGTAETALLVSDVEQARPHFFLTGGADRDITAVAIELSGTSPTEVTLDRIQLSLGRYADQPYTGDPFVQIFPKDCIVMTLGARCPAGFEELGDGDLVVPDEWSDEEPGIRPRVGNYPAKGTELAGSPKHGPDNGTTSTNSSSFESFEARTGRAATETGIGPTFLSESNNPLVDQELDHTHTVNKASSRVLAVEYLFCKRV